MVRRRQLLIAVRNIVERLRTRIYQDRADICTTHGCDDFVRDHLDAILARISIYTRTKPRTIRLAVFELYDSRVIAHNAIETRASSVGYQEPLCVGFVRELDRRVSNEFDRLHGLLLSYHKEGEADRPVDWTEENVELDRNLWPYRFVQL